MAENGNSSPQNGGGAESLLTEEELNAIHESWAVVWSDKKKNGIELFIKFFTLHPEAQDYFHDFKGLSIDEVRTHKKLRAHALSVMYAFKSFIDSLDDLDTLIELVQKNARSHAPRGVGEREIMWLLPALAQLLDDIMKGEVTELHKLAWTKLLQAVASISKEEQENMKASQ